LKTKSVQFRADLGFQHRDEAFFVSVVPGTGRGVDGVFQCPAVPREPW